MAARSALCVRMSMSRNFGNCIPLLLGALLSSPALAEEHEEPETEALDPGFVRVPNPAFPSPEVHVVPLDRGRKIDRKDLEPYFADGKRGQAKAAFDAGRWADVRTLLEGEGDELPVRYLRALSQARLNDNGAAAVELEALAAQWPAMRDRCLVQAGWAYEEGVLAARESDAECRSAELILTSP